MLLSLGSFIAPTELTANVYYQVSESPFSADIAGKPGDLLTVKVRDVTNTKDFGQVKDDKEVSQLWNLVDFIFPKVPFTYPVNNSQDGGGGSSGGTGVQGQGPGVYWSGKNRWDARADNQASHVVEMTVQARIVEEISRGQFYIKGYRTVIVHGKPRKLFVSGIVRRKDITDDNTIISDKLAESVIEVDGETVTDLQPGWIYKVFDALLF
jgi:flagellar basal body L-ring protein FlgH